MKTLAKLRILLIGTVIIGIIVLGGYFSLKANESKYISEDGTDIAIVNPNDTLGFDMGISTANSWSGRQAALSGISYDSEVALIGIYADQLHSTITFGLVDAENNLSVVFGGGHGGYEKILKKISLPYATTEYGYMIDVSTLKIDASQFEMVNVGQVKDQTKGTVKMNDDWAELTTLNSGSTSCGALITEKGKLVRAGFSGAPILQDNVLVGFVKSGKSEGSSSFTMTSIGAYIQLD